MTAVRKIEKEVSYTYNDYITWNDSENWEIIDGKAYAMAPSPTSKHQRISVKIASEYEHFLKSKPCRVFTELDVILSKRDIVKPDIFVVCDKDKITDKNVQGAPDLVVEILSPSTAKTDKTTKMELYKKSGVKEYWIVDTYYNEIFVYYFAENRTEEFYFEEEGENLIPVGIFGNELKLDLKYLFED